MKIQELEIKSEEFGRTVSMSEGKNCYASLMVMNAGKKLPFMFHRQKRVCYFVFNGTFEITHVDHTTGAELVDRVQAGRFIQIERSEPYQVACIEDGSLIYVSKGSPGSDQLLLKTA